MKYNGKEYYSQGDIYNAIEQKNKQLEIDKIHWRDLYREQLEKNKKLKEENETLKANVDFLHSCLDDRDKSIEIMKESGYKPITNKDIDEAMKKSREMINKIYDERRY